MVVPISKSSSSSSGSSISSLSSLTYSDDAVKSCGSSHGGSTHCGPNTVKFLCSYGGRILPRYPDGHLRYVGGDTRVLAVDRSVPFSELQSKMGELCGWGTRISIRCKLPTEDLDALVSVTSDEDLANLIEEYDFVNRDRASPMKVKAFIHVSPPPKPPSPPRSTSVSPPSSVRGRTPFAPSPVPFPVPVRRQSPPHPHGVSSHHHHHHQSPHHHQYYPNPHHLYVAHGSSAVASSSSSYSQQAHLIHNGNHWQ